MKKTTVCFLGSPDRVPSVLPKKPFPLTLFYGKLHRMANSVDKRLPMKEAHIYFGEALFFADGKHLFLDHMFTASVNSKMLLQQLP